MTALINPLKNCLPTFWPTQKYFDSRADIGTQGSAFLEFGKDDVMYRVGAVYFKIFTAVYPQQTFWLQIVYHVCKDKCINK